MGNLAQEDVTLTKVSMFLLFFAFIRRTENWLRVGYTAHCVLTDISWLLLATSFSISTLQHKLVLVHVFCLDHLSVCRCMCLCDCPVDCEKMAD